MNSRTCGHNLLLDDQIMNARTEQRLALVCLVKRRLAMMAVST